MWSIARVSRNEMGSLRRENRSAPMRSIARVSRSEMVRSEANGFDPLQCGRSRACRAVKWFAAKRMESICCERTVASAPRGVAVCSAAGESGLRGNSRDRCIQPLRGSRDRSCVRPLCSPLAVSRVIWSDALQATRCVACDLVGCSADHALCRVRFCRLICRPRAVSRTMCPAGHPLYRV
jgi:hypothetical protein